MAIQHREGLTVSPQHGTMQPAATTVGRRTDAAIFCWLLSVSAIILLSGSQAFAETGHSFSKNQQVVEGDSLQTNRQEVERHPESEDYKYWKVRWLSGGLLVLALIVHPFQGV